MSTLHDRAVAHLREVLNEPDLSGTKYRLIRRLASGGMGTVYLVQDTDLDRPVALKLLTLPDPSGALVEHMRREAKVIARLEHPGIVPIHDMGVCPDGRLFYVMKYVDGDRLLSAVRKLARLNERLQLFLRVCEAVAFAHSRGVIHRDLKPENIMVGPFGEVLVMDWGLAGLLDSAEESGSVVGTPDFMPPEQERGEKADERSDVYSLGATLRSILTDLGIPASVRAICGKATAAEAAERYDSVSAFAEDISRFLDELPVSAYRESLFEKAARWVSRNRFVVIIVMAYTIVRLLIFLTSRR